MNFVKKLKELQYPNTNTPVIVCFGDSVTHGAFCGPEFDFDAVYHERLRRMLIKENPWVPVSVINAGVAGDCARTAVSRVERDVINHHPDLCIVNFCLNDVNDPLDVYIASLREILTKIQSANIPLVLMTPNMMNTYVHPEVEPRFRDYAKTTADYQNSGRVDEYVDAERALAAELGIPVADAYAKWKEMAANGTDITLCLANRINHPLREHHQIFANALFDLLSSD